MSDVPRFKVFWSPHVRDLLKSKSRMVPVQTRKQLAEILLTLEARLAGDPLNLGEVYRSKDGIAEHLAVHDFLAIDFSVDEKRNLVLVRECQALSGHGLD